MLALAPVLEATTAAHSDHALLAPVDLQVMTMDTRISHTSKYCACASSIDISHTQLSVICSPHTHRQSRRAGSPSSSKSTRWTRELFVFTVTGGGGRQHRLNTKQAVTLTRSMLERVIEEKAEGDPDRAAEIRTQLAKEVCIHPLGVPRRIHPLGAS